MGRRWALETLAECAPSLPTMDGIVDETHHLSPHRQKVPPLGLPWGASMLGLCASTSGGTGLISGL